MGGSVLVVEDDDSVASALADVLHLNHYAVQRVSTAAAAIDHARSGWPTLVLLDLGLPDGSGLRVCRSIREVSALPIIVVSAKGDERQKVEALQAGADDYVTKPFGTRELLARIEAVLRRAPAAGDEPSEVWAIGHHAVLDVDARRLTVSESAQDLTRKELDLLVVLVRAGGNVVPRERLGAQVWRDTWVEDSRTLDVHVSGLRTKLGDRDAIQTVRGVGFRLAVPPERLS